MFLNEFFQFSVSWLVTEVTRITYSPSFQLSYALVALLIGSQTISYPTEINF